jgi:hypothetical protein
MKKLLLSLFVVSALMLSVVPGIFAASVGLGQGITITTEDFPPQVWGCGDRVVMDDGTEPGRVSEDGQTLIERINNYAFEGEQIQWRVLVLDKNGIEKVGDVYVTVGGDIQANCKLDHVLTAQETIDEDCNARIDEESLTTVGHDNVAAYYTCTLTVEAPTDDETTNMHGEKDVTVEVTDLDGDIGTMAEMERWFFNPIIALKIDGTIEFENVRQGTMAYSDLVTVKNGAEEDSGVMLDMFISGTDFYDTSSSGAKCGLSNQLELSNFAYHVTDGAYSSDDDLEVGRTCDSEGYCQINYGIGFNDPHPFYNANEILQMQKVGPYYMANILAPGADIGLTFRLNLPEPCNGDFDNGQIYFWGEAI